jgi:hypothetical protein
MSFFDPDDFVSDDDSDYRYSFDSSAGSGENDLMFIPCCMVKHHFSLANKNGYFLIEIGDDGLLLEPSIKSHVYDLDRSHALKVRGVDEVW